MVLWRRVSIGWVGMVGMSRGSLSPAGVYLYRLQMGEQTRVRKMVKLD